MHPLPAEHAHSLRNGRLCRAVLWLIVALAWTGCEAEAPSAQLLAPNDTLFPDAEEERTAALAVLDAMKQDAIGQAFERLPHYAFTHRVRTDQIDSADSILAVRERVLRFPPPDSADRPLVVQTDSVGTFGRGVLDRLASAGDEMIPPTEIARHTLPSDPPYLEPRTREAFRYRLRTDTLDGRIPVRVVEVHAQPGALGADQAIRYARLYVAPDSDQLIGLYLVRADAGMLFREDSRTLVHLHPAPDSGWVPARTDFQAHVDMRLRAREAFHTTATFSGYRPVE